VGGARYLFVVCPSSFGCPCLQQPHYNHMALWSYTSDTPLSPSSPVLVMSLRPHLSQALDPASPASARVPFSLGDFTAIFDLCLQILTFQPRLPSLHYDDICAVPLVFHLI
jgi:hypothetical protein